MGRTRDVHTVPSALGRTMIDLLLLALGVGVFGLMAAYVAGCERVWGPAHAEETQYLRVYVGHLRQKLGAASRLIRTEPGVGYQFGADEH
jgi:two-component system KDP operon response regulator KdpE